MPRLSTGLANTLLNTGLAAAFDGGNARIAFYSGAMPATGDGAAVGTLGATLTPGSDVFGTAASREIAANAITSDNQADAAIHPQSAVLYRTGDTAPGSAALAADLRLWLSVGVSSPLNGAINASVTTIPVDSTLGFPASGSILIDSEIITYSGISGNSFTGCTRGTGGTTAASHSDNAVVAEYGVDCNVDNAGFGGSGETATFVVNAVVPMTSLVIIAPS